jgi:hypothetical protein
MCSNTVGAFTNSGGGCAGTVNYVMTQWGDVLIKREDVLAQWKDVLAQWKDVQAQWMDVLS